MEHAVIRFLKANDVADILNVIEEQGEQIFDLRDREYFQYQIDSFLTQDKNENYFLYVLELHSRCIGVIMFAREKDSLVYAQATCIAIQKSYQRQGFGTYILNESLQRVKTASISHIYVKTSNAEYNMRAQQFYISLGFTKLGILPKYYNATSLDPTDREDCALYYKAL